MFGLMNFDCNTQFSPLAALSEVASSVDDENFENEVSGRGRARGRARARARGRARGRAGARGGTRIGSVSSRGTRGTRGTRGRGTRGTRGGRGASTTQSIISTTPTSSQPSTPTSQPSTPTSSQPSTLSPPTKRSYTPEDDLTLLLEYQKVGSNYALILENIQKEKHLLVTLSVQNDKDVKAIGAHIRDLKKSHLEGKYSKEYERKPSQVETAESVEEERELILAHTRKEDRLVNVYKQIKALAKQIDSEDHLYSSTTKPTNVSEINQLSERFNSFH
jgi:hypothetical protein